MLNLIDVGGSGGLHPKWERFLDRLHPVLFECNPKEAASLRERYALAQSVTIIQKALSDRNCIKSLNIAKHFGCTSLRIPNYAFLRDYPIARQFEIVDQAEVECERYDTLYKDGLVPTPDVIKIDVQGCEYEAHEGFGNLLSNCISVELEAHFYPLYEGQQLIGEITQLLSKHDLILKRIRPIKHFEDDLVEVDAFFGPSRAAEARMNHERRRQLHFVNAVLKD